MGYLLSFVIMNVEFISSILIFDAVLERRKTGWKFWLITYPECLLAFIAVNFLPVSVSFVKSAITCTLWFTLTIIGYQGQWAKKIFATIGSYITIYVTDYVVTVAMMLILRIDQTSLYNSPAYFILTTFFSKLLLFWLTFLFKKKQRKNYQNRNGSISFTEWLSLLIFPFVTMVTLIFLMQGAANEGVSLGLLLNAAGLLLANIALTFLLEKLEQDNQIRQNNVMLEQQVKTEVQTATALMDAYASQRRLTHDFSNQLAAIAGLLQQGKADAAEGYVSKLIKTGRERILVVNTKNPIVDAVLNQKYITATQKDILMEFTVNDLSCLPISNEDAVTILANVLDNAVEACAHNKGKKHILIKFLCEAGGTVLSVRNKAEQSVNIEGDAVVTTKQDKHLHGYGLLNVKNALKKYDYSYALEYKNGWFQFSTVMD